MRGVVIGFKPGTSCWLATSISRRYFQAARKAAFSANLLGRIGSPLVVRIFSVTPSMK
jgi:hypothetical protein